MRVTRHICLTLAMLVGLALIDLARPAQAHNGHHAHRAMTAQQPDVVDAAARPPVAEVLSRGLVPSGPALIASGPIGHGVHHAACCIAGLGCPICAPILVDTEIGPPVRWTGRPFWPAPSPQASAEREAPLKPPRTV